MKILWLLPCSPVRFEPYNFLVVNAHELGFAGCLMSWLLPTSQAA